MAEPYYCTAEELRTELGVEQATLPDPAAISLIETAEDIIDEDLGIGAVDDTTGRRIIQASVEAWQFTKLKRATVKLAAFLHRNPGVLTQSRYRRVSGPDFSFSEPIGSLFGLEVELPLNQSGLRRLTTTLDGRPARPPWRDFIVNDSSFD